MKTCPDCLAEIPDAAVFCRFCGERVEGKPCPSCGVLNWDEAVACRWCGHRYARPRSRVERFEPFEVSARVLPTVLQRGRFLPQTIRLTPEKIVISTPGPFNLSRKEEEIPWNRVAGFDYRSGIFWDRLTIETRGQSSSKVPCLAKGDGQRVRAILQQLET
jgi:ribosomal protein L40E